VPAGRAGYQGEGLGTRSWDLDLAHARCSGALGDVAGQQPERVLFGCRFDRPPDRVPAEAARRQGCPVAKWTSVSLEGGEDDAALIRLVAMVEQVAGHEPSLLPRRRCDIGAPP